MPHLEKINNETQLRITISDNEKQDIAEALHVHGGLDTWFEMLEPKLCNGWTAPSCDEFALCSNPFLLTDDVSYDENDDPIYGRVYFYEPHQVKCPVEELLAHGVVVLNGSECENIH